MQRVLVVEDDARFAHAMLRVLSGRPSSRVLALAPSLKEAVVAIRTEQQHVVVANVQLPDGTGWEVLAEARRRSTRLGLEPAALPKRPLALASTQANSYRE